MLATIRIVEAIVTKKNIILIVKRMDVPQALPLFNSRDFFKVLVAMIPVVNVMVSKELQF